MYRVSCFVHQRRIVFSVLVLLSLSIVIVISGCDVLSPSDYPSSNIDKVFENDHAGPNSRIFPVGAGYQLIHPGGNSIVMQTIDETGEIVERKNILLAHSLTQGQTIQTSDGDYLIFGADKANDRLMAVSLLQTGEIIWTKYYPEFVQYYVYKAQDMNNGIILLTANSYNETSKGPTKYILLSSDSGTVLTSRDAGNDLMESIQTLPNGNIAGLQVRRDSSPSFYYDHYLIELDHSLQRVSERKVITPTDSMFWISCMLLGDTAMLYFGTTHPPSGEKIRIVLQRSDGTTIWKQDLSMVRTGLENIFLADWQVIGSTIYLITDSFLGAKFFSVSLTGTVLERREMEIRHFVSLCRRSIGGCLVTGFLNQGSSLYLFSSE